MLLLLSIWVKVLIAVLLWLPRYLENWKNRKKSRNFIQQSPQKKNASFAPTLEAIPFLTRVSVIRAAGTEPIFAAPIRLSFRKAKQVSTSFGF
ncbi:hypothetical protein X975_19235, partial [Stegodyphus mimosarum]